MFFTVKYRRWKPSKTVLSSCQMLYIYIYIFRFVQFCCYLRQIDIFGGFYISVSDCIGKDYVKVVHGPCLSPHSCYTRFLAHRIYLSDFCHHFNLNPTDRTHILCARYLLYAPYFDTMTVMKCLRMAYIVSYLCIY